MPIDGIAAETDLCCLGVDDRGDLWVSTNVRGVYRYREGRWQRFDEAGPSISKIWNAADGSLLLEGGGRVVRVQQGELREVPSEAHRGRRQAFVLENALPPNAPAASAAVFEPALNSYWQSIHVTRTGTVWLGLSGLTRIAGTDRRVFRVSDGVASENVLSIFEDREGNVWTGHYGTGLTQMSRVPFFNLSRREGLAGGAAFSLAEAKDGAVWISQSSGLSEVRDGAVRNWWSSERHPFWGIRSIAVDAEDGLWMTLIPRGLARLRGEALEVFPLPRQSEERTATALMIGKDGTVWTAASDGGLLRFTGEGFEEIALPELGGYGCDIPISVEHPCPQAINVIAERGRGGLWLGTTQRGLWRWDRSGRLVQVPGAPLAHAMVYSLLETNDEGLWVGTDRGLFLVAPDRTVQLTRKEGLVSDGVFSILDDAQGRYWMGSERGVYSVRRDELQAVIEGQKAAVDPVSYRALDGLPSDEMIRRFEPTAIRTRDGRLWFSAVAGVAIFQPPALVPKLPPPEALLERVVLKGRSFTPPWPRDTATIAPGSGDLEFHYTAPAFAAPHRLRFQYKLEGFDGDWVRAGSRRAAYYTNIPPGPYTFRVKADTTESGPSQQEASFAFVLAPEFHETIWFYLLLGALLLLMAIVIQRKRIRAVQAKFAAVLDERNRIARDLHDTLAQVFSAIGFQIDSAAGLAGQASPVLKERLKRVRQMVAHARLAARNVIWNLRHAEGAESSVQSLVSKLEAIPPLYDTARIMVNVSGQARALPASVENELFHIAQEAVSNAVEHGKAELISIELEVAETKLELLIHDDGVGFQPEPGNAGHEARFGLRGMRERAHRIGSEITMHAEPEVGTEISVTVPLPPAKTPG